MGEHDDTDVYSINSNFAHQKHTPSIENSGSPCEKQYHEKPYSLYVTVIRKLVDCQIEQSPILRSALDSRYSTARNIYRENTDDGCSEQCGEPTPMDVAGIHEAVEGILGKGEGSALEVNLHGERSMRKDCREGDEEDATMFVGICRAKNTADVVMPEEILHFLGQLIFRAVGLCYTSHGISLHWMFLLVLKLYQMDVAHAILFARKLDISRDTAHHLSAKFEYM